jgi:hypothetical protein
MSDEPTKQQDGEPEAESSETVREAFMKQIANDPRFREARKSGKAFVIVGQEPQQDEPPHSRDPHSRSREDR